MADKLKAPLILLIALILISLLLSAGVFFLLQKERAKTITLQAELANVKELQKVTEIKLNESKKLITDFELKLQEAQAQITTLTQSLEQEKVARREASDQLENLRSELKQQKELRAELENKLTQAQEDTRKLQAQVSEMNAKKAGLETKIKELEEQVEDIQTRDIELGKIIVAPDTDDELAQEEVAAPSKTTSPAKAASKNESKPEPQKTAKPEVESKVLVVNREYNFAVINVGSKDGVRVGDVYSVFHAGKIVGEIKVDKVHDSMAAAGFVTPDMKDKISEGDKIVRKRK